MLIVVPRPNRGSCAHQNASRIGAVLQCTLPAVIISVRGNFARRAHLCGTDESLAIVIRAQIHSIDPCHRARI